MMSSSALACVILLMIGFTSARSAPLSDSLPPAHSAALDEDENVDETDLPQGDQPYRYDNFTVHESILSDRERDKNRRISNIKSTLLKYLRGGGANGEHHHPGHHHYHDPSSPTHWRIVQAMTDGSTATSTSQLHHVSKHSDVFTEKLQSFFPSCDVPRNTDEDTWLMSQSMNLYFTLNLPQEGPHQQHSTTVSVKFANLRLYKIQTNGSESEADNRNSKKHHYDRSINDQEDKKIRVSVFWYTRPLKKNKAVKRKLLDSQMISAYSEAWTEWNIRTAVQGWQGTGKNFGLSVQVEDEDGRILKADRYFLPMNCSYEATSTLVPVPSFLLDPSKLRNDDPRYVLPMVDLCTVEAPPRQPSSARYTVPKHRHHHGDSRISDESTIDDSSSAITDQSATNPLSG